MWKSIGEQLKYSKSQLDAIGRDCNGNKRVCWCYLMEMWLYAEVPHNSYPTTWEGLCKLLADADCINTVKLLKIVLHRAEKPEFCRASTDISGTFGINQPLS